MQFLKNFIIDHFERVLVFLIMAGVAAIVYFIPYKLSFLNIFYIPMLLSALYLGPRAAVLGSFLTFLIVVIFAVIEPGAFINPSDNLGVWSSIISWGGFLVLTAVVLGYTNQKLREQMTEAIKVRAELTGNMALLEETTTALQDFEKNLDAKVRRRTQAIEESAKLIEAHKDKVEEALHSTMDPAVVKLLIEKRLRTENRRISVQFCDLKGFTRYAEEKSAEVVLSELNTYLAEMEKILLLYNAHIDKYMGDGIMTEFGAPTSFAKHALLAVSAGWKMQQCMNRLNFPWQLRVGIATGVSTTGIIGAKRLSYTAFGDTVNLASRIEGLCEPGKVTVDEATYLECKDYYDFKQKGYSSLNQKQSENLINQINDTLDKIEEDSENIELYTQVADLLLEASDTEQALEHLKKAMKIAPKNNKIKVAYADASVKHSSQLDMQIRGRKKPIHVFEVIDLKDPVRDFSRIPEEFYKEIKDRIKKVVPYPEDIILPVECLDGSIGFSRLVGVVSFMIAHRMNLDTPEKNDILEAAYFADLGKTIVPENILNREGQLTDEEFKSIHMHPRESVRTLRNMGYENQNMLKIIESHHENFNGTGYPAGLSNTAVPLGSRILAIAEAYVSLTSNRPYRDAWESIPAYQELVKYTSMGKFDPEVTKVLGDIVNEIEAA